MSDTDARSTAYYKEVIMALCRCSKHSKIKNKNKQPKYIVYTKPVGYPDTSSICGRKECNDPGFIWLTSLEATEYRNGQRIFKISNYSVKMKADDSGLHQQGDQLSN